MVLSGELRFNNVWDTLNRWNKVYSLYSTSGVDGYVYDRLKPFRFEFFYDIFRNEILIISYDNIV